MVPMSSNTFFISFYFSVLPKVFSFSSPHQTLESITVTWEAPITNCNISGYYLQYKGRDGDYSDSNYSDTTSLYYNNPETNEAVIENLSPNYYYQFEIQPYNDEGLGHVDYLSQYTDGELLLMHVWSFHSWIHFLIPCPIPKTICTISF